MKWLIIKKPRPQFWHTTLVASAIAVFIFQSCGDPGFNTAGPREDIHKIDLASVSIDNIVQLETPRGKIDLLSGTVTNFTQVRSMSPEEITEAAAVFGSVELCKFILPPGMRVCLAMPIMDHIFTLSDGSQTSTAAGSICYNESLCPTTANAIKDLMDSLLVFP